MRNSEPADLAEVVTERFGGDGADVTVASAPGRVNLIGGHTDYNDGFVLPVAIDRRTAVAARPRTDRTVRVFSTNVGETRTFSLDAPATEESSWVGYVEGVARSLADEAPSPVSGLDLAVRGNVPMGGGLSSSASLELAAATALNETWTLGHDRTELADRCWRVEREFVGVECGIMDQFVVALGESDRALFLDCRTREYERYPLDGDVRVVVTNTNVEHELVDSAYNERVAQCREGVELLAESLSHDVNALRDVSVAEFEERAETLPGTVRDRCEHVVRENERVKTAANALETGDMERVGALMGESHRSLRDSYEVSCEELDFVVETAESVDAELGSRMTGAGFGGCVVSLVRSDSVESFTETVRAAYAAETGIEPDIFPCAVGDGARVENGPSE
ncbi:galactokinase [Haladaptatus paucihalophilus DX253]|uniref:Galactokinase n=1 Tax=Haladaptatus paucihalophilus DX253 TaxID=797209 RepID=E7QV03_HALPU|nr:galactokinase [Haladaptatus paucihalophilus]EFW91521.1 galactokinase [Haladaptatus paucihalophilus DX253]SHL25816.1 galactokinase [Haladaptatus paucihalophilus DX253]